jgi:hypothetical protein
MLMVRPTGWMTKTRGSLIALGVLLLVVIRSIAEILRIDDPAAGVSDRQYHYLVGVLVAASAALVVLLLHAFGRHLVAIWLSVAVVLALFAYKIVSVL